MLFVNDALAELALGYNLSFKYILYLLLLLSLFFVSVDLKRFVPG